jgi:hypothetical protein
MDEGFNPPTVPEGQSCAAKENITAQAVHDVD